MRLKETKGKSWLNSNLMQSLVEREKVQLMLELDLFYSTFEKIRH